MAETGIRLRLIIIVFTLACLSIVFSSVLLVSYWLSPTAGNTVALAKDPLGQVEANLLHGKTDLAWDQLSTLANRKDFLFGTRGISLLWKVWKLDQRSAELRDIGRHIFESTNSDNDKALVCYLFLEANQGDVAAALSRSGYWTSLHPELESEIALHRTEFVSPRFAELDRGSFSKDSRLELDRAFAWGYLGDFVEARVAANRIIEMTDAPGRNGSTGIIDINRGLCRRQAARMVQIMSVWDSADPNFETLMHTALVELLVDPIGLVQVAPVYFDILCDVAAWTGDRTRLERLYRSADAVGHSLPDEQRENRSILVKDSTLRPETHADLRRILATNQSGDPRFRLPELNESAGSHNDERSWRLVAWYYQKTGDWEGLNQLLGRNTIRHGAWHSFYEAVVAEKSGDLEAAFAAFQKARQGALDTVAQLNQARLLLREGKVEGAANLAGAARQGIEVRSIGLAHETNSPYAVLYADALALQSRILRAQGRETESQMLLQKLSQIAPDHPELYNAIGLEVKLEPTENHQ